MSSAGDHIFGSSMEEIAKDAALYADAKNFEDIAIK
jgi:hypothetical protein